MIVITYMFDTKIIRITDNLNILTWKIFNEKYIDPQTISLALKHNFILNIYVYLRLESI